MLTFVESRLFTRLVSRYFDDSEYVLLQARLAVHPRAGTVVPGGGGIRKLRWPGRGRGKRGGLRVVYFLRLDDGEIWLLTLYVKNEAEDLPLHLLRRIREEIDD